MEYRVSNRIGPNITVDHSRRQGQNDGRIARRFLADGSRQVETANTQLRLAQLCIAAPRDRASARRRNQPAILRSAARSPLVIGVLQFKAVAAAERSACEAHIPCFGSGNAFRAGRCGRSFGSSTAPRASGLYSTAEITVPAESEAEACAKAADQLRRRGLKLASAA
jgi:hypothetical protein